MAGNAVEWQTRECKLCRQRDFVGIWTTFVYYVMCVCLGSCI